LREDPIGLMGGVNLYSYVLSNPIKLLDPKGLIGGGFGAYIGFGGEAGINVVTCCEGKKKYRFVVFTICGGVGIGAKNVKAPPMNSSLSVGGFSSDTECPRNKTYYRHDISMLYRTAGVNINLSRGGVPASADIGAGITGVGVTWKICGDSIISKKYLGCCN